MSAIHENNRLYAQSCLPNGAEIVSLNIARRGVDNQVCLVVVYTYQGKTWRAKLGKVA